MPFMGKTDNGYSELSTIVNSSGTEIDYVLSKTDDGYKRTFTKQRELTGEVPLSFKGITPALDLTNYRIYGQMSRNLFDMKKFAELCYPRYASVTFADNTLSFTSTAIDAYVNYVCDKGDTVSDIYRPSCIDVLPSTTYTISMSSMPKCYISWIDNSYKAVRTYTRIPVNQSYYTFTTPSNCTKLLIRLGKEVTNIGDTFTISNIMLNEGSTPLPYETYGKSVGDRTGNILPMSTTPIDTIIDDFHCEYDGMGTIKLTALTDNAVLSGFTVPLSKNFTIPVSIGQGGTGCWQMNNDAAYNNADNNAAFCLNLKDDTQLRDNWTLSVINRISNAYRTMGEANINSIQILTTVGVATNIQSGQTLTISPAFVENVTVQVPFEPYGYKVPVTVEGKNLLQNTATSRTINGVTFTVNDDGTVTCNGTATANTFYYVGQAPINNKYILNGCPKNGSGSSYLLRIITNLTSLVIGSDIGNGVEYNTDINSYCEIRIASGYTCNNLTFYPMIRKADIEDDTYEPYHAPVTTPIYLPEPIKMVGGEAEYIDYGEQKMHRVRKNLLQNTATSKTSSSLSIIVNDDKSVSINGSRSDSWYDFALNGAWASTEEIVPSGDYVISINGEFLEFIEVYAVYNTSTIAKLTASEPTKTVTSAHISYVFIRLLANSTFTDTLVQVMIRTADIEDDTYEPYIENTDLDVTLPALPTIAGTNTLSVGTEVQPSSIYLKGAIKALPSGGDT